MAAGITTECLVAEMDKALQFPGVSNAWTMPIKARIDMLATGIRTPVGIKVLGKDLTELDQVAKQIETVVRNVPGTTSAYAERVIGGYYLESCPIAMLLPATVFYRQSAGHHRHGAWRRGGDHDRRRPRALHGQCPLSPRFPRQPGSHRARRAGAACRPAAPYPSAKSPRCSRRAGRTPSAPRTVSSQSTSMSTCKAAISGSYVADAQKAVADNIKFPTGTYVQWSGQFEYMQRAIAKLKIVVPLTLAIIFLLLYLNFGTLTETLIVMLSLPFALVGGLWLMWWLGFNMSVAVAVGFIALAGVAAETGVVMLIYLDHAVQGGEGRPANAAKALLHQATPHHRHHARRRGARPAEMMTVVAIMAGLLPILWSTGTGSEVMQRSPCP